MSDTVESLEVRRDDLHTTRIVEEPTPELRDGQARLRVDRFGFSTNNITYGVAGDSIGYWNFFPSANDGWGRLPVWGFADVAESQVDGLETGTRVFGYLPPSSHLVVEPTKVSPGGFIDGAAHRAALPAVYNRYQRTDADPMHRPDTEDLQAIFAPLFITSFVLDDYLADNDDFGATQIVLSSASSKTAAGTALCISRRDGDRPRIVGLTSAANVEFTEGLGFYDEVVVYDDVGRLDSSTPAVFVDLAGNAAIRRAVHEHFGEQLKSSITVGITHGEAPPPEALPGPTPAMFFAPSQIEKRIAEWGPAGYQKRLARSWGHLFEVVHGWVDIVELSGLAELTDAYLQMLDGATRPDHAFMVDV